MKISGYKFGHPVFGIDDYYDFKPELVIETDIIDDNLVIKSNKFDLGSNNDLKHLIENDKASLLAEVFCSWTMYRKSFKSKEKIDITIPTSRLKNKIETLYLIVAKEDIPDYTNSSVKTELQGQSFYIEKGDILGFLGEEKITLDVSTSMDSIVKIRESREKKVHTFIWTESSIIINLPSLLYAKLNKFKASLEYQKILVSSVLQSALIHACYKLEIDGTYSEKNWHKALLLHWQDYSELENVPTNEDIPEFVESLLRKPFGLLIDTIDELDGKLRNNVD